MEKKLVVQNVKSKTATLALEALANYPNVYHNNHHVVINMWKTKNSVTMVV